jgi:hypothetical protein
MLNGIDPIIIFNFYKLDLAAQEAVAKIPIVSDIVNKIGLPVIPIYLSESLTGLYVDTEEKHIDIETSTDTLSNGDTPKVNQKGINSVVRVNLIASRDSVGVTLLAALADKVFEKVTSKEYSITYLNGAVTIFGGLLHSFQINQNSENDLYSVTLEITKGSAVKTQDKEPIPVIKKVVGAIPL